MTGLDMARLQTFLAHKSRVAVRLSFADRLCRTLSWGAVGWAVAELFWVRIDGRPWWPALLSLSIASAARAGAAWAGWQALGYRRAIAEIHRRMRQGPEALFAWLEEP